MMVAAPPPPASARVARGGGGCWSAGRGGREGRCRVCPWHTRVNSSELQGHVQRGMAVSWAAAGFGWASTSQVAIRFSQAQVYYEFPPLSTSIKQ